jgi:hypothetical protein
VRDPQTATRCEASGEGGAPNLTCTRTTRNRFEIVFYNDVLLVLDLQNRRNLQPLEPNYTFNWMAAKE